MSQLEPDKDGWRSSGSVGKALKFNSGWEDNGNGDNSSGFAALPGGYRTYDGGFYTIDRAAFFWSYSGDGSYAWFPHLHCNYNDGVIRSYDEFRSAGYSVRCIKD